MTAAPKKAKSKEKKNPAAKSRPAVKGTRATGKAAKKAAAPRVAPGSAAKAAPPEAPRPPARRYLKSKPVCKVTFRLPAEAAPDAARVCLVGDFNGWDRSASPLRRLKDGSFTVTVDLEAGREYRFRYLVDDCRWENDWCADRYEQNSFGEDDSIVAI